MFLLALLFCLAASSNAQSGGLGAGGIPVPGQGVSALDVFGLMSSSCAGSGREDVSAREIIANSLQMLRGGSAGERIGQRMLEKLVGGVGEVAVGPLMGRWVRVLQSAALGPGCVRTHFSLLSDAPYAGVFTATSYHSGEGGADFSTSHGYGLQVGPGPARTLLFPHEDPCPYVVVKRGPLNDQGLYDYLILSQFLKTPVIGLARDPLAFANKYKAEVETFLRTSGFISPFAAANTALAYTDFAACPYDSHSPFG